MADPRFVGPRPPAPVDVVELARFWSEWTDDQAPLNERGVYRQAAEDFLRKYTVERKSHG